MEAPRLFKLKNPRIPTVFPRIRLMDFEQSDIRSQHYKSSTSLGFLNELLQPDTMSNVNFK